MHRRALFRHGVHTGVALASTASVAHAQATGSTPGIITIIDIDRCDGCRHLHMPRCVAACRQEKISEIPEPKRPLQPYWPQTRFEDYSDQRERFDRLTPYNLTFVQTVEVKGRHLHIPRRCMHCYDAPCRKLCPFGAIERTQQGAVRIDHKICFGGAKCRDVCPWEIPQRQAGVGLYLDIAPKFAGGGLMYKCDLCASRLERGEQPACITACPRKALLAGSLQTMSAWLEQNQRGRHVYGRTENGGTATWYVSSVPFDEIDRAITAQAAHGKNSARGRPAFPNARPRLEQTSRLAAATLAAPIVAIGGALVLRHRRKKEDS